MIRCYRSCASDSDAFAIGLLCTYLAGCVGRGEALRLLRRGFNHWSSGRLRQR